MTIYICSDTHFNHAKIETYCQRPADFTERIIKNWRQIIKPEDTIIHLGDVFIGKAEGWKAIYPQLTGRKILIRGNHDRNHSNSWWMDNGFDFACDSLQFRDILFTHEPANAVIKADGWEKYGSIEAGLPEGCELNIHGHLHNIWDGFHKPERLERDKELLGIDFTKQLKYPWQRLFAIEYTNYAPVGLEKFLANPDKYQARGPRKAEESGL